MWRNFGLMKFDMFRVKDNDNIIHTVLPWHGWYLCCFIAKSVQLQFTLLCRKIYFVAIYAHSMWRKIWSNICSVVDTIQFLKCNHGKYL